MTATIDMTQNIINMPLESFKFKDSFQYRYFARVGYQVSDMGGSNIEYVSDIITLPEEFTLTDVVDAMGLTVKVGAHVVALSKL